MKKILAILFLVPTMAFAVETYMVLDWNATTRIVLQDASCLVKGLTGSRAAVQRDDGQHIKGCWKYVDGSKHIRIDWDNPVVKGDFAVLDATRFRVVQE